MKLELHDNKDFWTGMMLIRIGAATMFIARDYRFGDVDLRAYFYNLRPHILLRKVASRWMMTR
jgi:hypothetical protein